jgi:hypothetical protein
MGSWVIGQSIVAVAHHEQPAPAAAVDVAAGQHTTAPKPGWALVGWYAEIDPRAAPER